MDPREKLNQSEIAAVLGLSPARIRGLELDGVIQRPGGKYVLADTVQAYVNFLKKGEAASSRDLEKAKLAADVKYRENKAEIMRLEAEELKGRMHRSEDVEALTTDFVYVVRSTLLAMIGRLAVDTAPIDNPAEAAVVIRHEVYRAMEGLSGYRYDPQKYIERVRDRRKWEEIMQDDQEEQRRS